ncbi:MAG: flagellin lysine-N-methylase [Clostridia bacterium]|nr:flagellin lysine-N-methylase [Clostridia bacterium]
MSKEINIFPDYYGEFSCIANKCKHNCCIGWEIDIDEDSLARYKADGIPNIVDVEGDLSHFQLVGADRCAFLREDGLCNLILDHGEDYLCQICTDHPRFRNYWTGIVETGLGLSCEEAARIILGRTEPLKFVAEEGSDLDAAIEALPEDEDYLWFLREGLLAQAAEIPDSMTARLTEYFIFRQLPDALYDGLLDERIQFIRDSVNTITERWDSLENPSFEAMVEIARAYSAEIEYNPSKLREILESYSV